MVLSPKRRILQSSVRSAIDLLAILQKSLDRALFLYIFINEVRLSGVRASIIIVHMKILQNVMKYRSNATQLNFL